METLNESVVPRTRNCGQVQRCIISGAFLFLFCIFVPSASVFAPVVSVCEIRANGAELVCAGPEQLLNYTGELDRVTQIEVRCNAPTTEKAPENPPPLEVPKLRILKVAECGSEGLKWLQNVRHSGHIFLNLNGNLMGGLDWQLARKFQAAKINFTDNPLNCSCQNKWLFDFQVGTTNQSVTSSFLNLPTIVTLRRPDEDDAECNIKCPTEEIKLQPPTINTTRSASATLTCKMRGSIPYNFQPEELFRWPTNNDVAYKERRQRWKVEKEGQDTYKMQIWNLSSDDLGIVVCECLECQYPRYAYSEFHFDTPISAKIEHIDSEDTHLTVQGYPLRAVTLTLRRVSDNVTETKELTTSNKGKLRSQNFFKSQIIFKYLDDLSFGTVKHYLVTLPMDAKPDTYLIKVCAMPDDCSEIEARLIHHTLDQVDRDPSFLANPPSTSTFAYFIFVLLVVGALGALLLSIFHYYRRDRTASKLANAVSWHKKRGFRRISRNTNRTEETSLRMDDSLSATMSNYSLQHVPVIDKDHLVLEDKIGKGAFGEVFIGEWRTRGVRVAVKILHGVQVDAQMDKEAAMLAALDHDNVVKMFGVSKASDQQSLYLVLELMNMGDLKTYVKNREPQCENYSQFPPSLLPTELINIAQQICTGLCYIHMQQIVHRDLAARNCLVSGETDMRVCNAAFRPPITVKISDFGMSRRLYSQAEYYKMGDQKTALPVRWLPPECLESGRFTYQSDMWAFGVTLYELFTYGAMPYGDLSNNEALMAVISGVRPTVPAKCPPEIANLMKECWKAAPDERPPADDAIMRLKMIQ